MAVDDILSQAEPLMPIDFFTVSAEVLFARGDSRFKIFSKGILFAKYLRFAWGREICRRWH